MTAREEVPSSNDLDMKLDEIEARLKAATPGPWRWVDPTNSNFAYGLVGQDDNSVIGWYSQDDWTCDEESESFIAHSWQDVMDLLARVRQLETALATYADEKNWTDLSDNSDVWMDGWAWNGEADDPASIAKNALAGGPL